MNFTKEDKKCIKEFSTFLLQLSPNEFTAFAFFFGYLLSQYMDPYSQQSAGNFFECVGQVMLTISSQQFTINNFKQKNGQNNS